MCGCKRSTSGGENRVKRERGAVDRRNSKEDVGDGGVGVGKSTLGLVVLVRDDPVTHSEHDVLTDMIRGVVSGGSPMSPGLGYGTTILIDFLEELPNALHLFRSPGLLKRTDSAQSL